MLQSNVWLFARLSSQEQRRLESIVQVLVAEKNWEACGGLTMTDEIKLTIAAQAALLVLAFPDEYYDRVQSILVYPQAYVAPTRIEAGGVILEGQSSRLGEAWYRGPVILSWDDVLAAGHNLTRDRNVVLHEFAHQLDMQNGRSADGIPPQPNQLALDRWERIVAHEFNELRRACELGLPTRLDCYAATNRAEFFAVATEAFFTRPQATRAHQRELYTLLRDFYRQDPAAD